jgi:hypothetical protein
MPLPAKRSGGSESTLALHSNRHADRRPGGQKLVAELL